jgi:hypothetical protein
VSIAIEDSLITLLITMQVLAACAAIVFMQIVTKDAGWHSRVALLLLAHRATYLFLIAVLAISAWHISVVWQLPPFYDVLTEMGWAFVTFASYLRHARAPRVPSEASWRHPVSLVTVVDNIPRTASRA